MANIKSILFVLVAVATVFTSPVVGLLAGIVFAVVFGNPLPSVSKKISKNIGCGVGFRYERARGFTVGQRRYVDDYCFGFGCARNRLVLG